MSMGMEEPRWTASSGYAHGRLWRAIETAMTHDDPETRRRASEKALAWEAVIGGIAGGTLNVGSRTPVADTPAWVTLEVVQGGFATGRFVAAGLLTDDERDLLARISGRSLEEGHPVLVTDRQRLNTWFLSDQGLARLAEMLRSGRYEVEIPEHGALLVVAWLMDNGHEAMALNVVATLHPFFERLRFYPLRAERPASGGTVVRLRSVGDVVRQLGEVTVPHQVAAMHETLRVWHPLYDRLVALWLDTIDPRDLADRAESGDDDLGWPCARWPADWPGHRRRWLDDYDEATRLHDLCGEHRKASSTFAVLRSALERCEHDSSALTGRDVGRLRAVLAASVARWGTPGSPRHTALRQAQADMAVRPTHQDLAAVLVERLAALPQKGGIGQLDPIVAPVPLDGEGTSSDGDATSPIPLPPCLVRKVERALEAPVEELVERRIIASSEVLAQVLPQISSHVASAAFADPALRELYARVYAAFRRRRSLLLLNLEHQVQIEELPWTGCLMPLATATSAVRDRATDTLRQSALLALTSFPHTVLPNRLVREMDSLAQLAELDIPFVEEVAADIFIGTFTTKWRRAASRAAVVMAGTLYARYYGLPDAEAWPELPPGRDGEDLPDDRRRTGLRWGTRTAEDFTRMCDERSREAVAGDGSYVARNGAIIEQSQILTTHNLAPLVDTLDLHERLQPHARDLVVRVFDWIVRQQTTRRDDWRSQLQMIKNTAYAWRQAIFLLSLLDPLPQHHALRQLEASMAGGPAEWQRRFRPAVDGLASVVEGGTFSAAGILGTGRRFLGWSVGRHWLQPPRLETSAARRQ